MATGRVTTGPGSTTPAGKTDYVARTADTGRLPRQRVAPASRKKGRARPDAGLDTGRVIIEHISPQVDGGRFAIKRCDGDILVVEADIYLDGHEALCCLLLHRRPGEALWLESAMSPLGNDRWGGEIRLDGLGLHEYTVLAWPDPLRTWRHDIARWTEAADIAIALQAGAALLQNLASHGESQDARPLLAWAKALLDQGSSITARQALALDQDLHVLADQLADRDAASMPDAPLRVFVEPPLARFSSWYEMFPRSCGRRGVHGSFRDCMARLPYIADLGFDVLYLPPIHPIGSSRRKGADNALVARPGEPGSPWAIGSAEGGHKAIHPLLGTLADFHQLVEAARAKGIEIALDIAFQCSPDHPYLREHPEWFRHRPDGSIQYAENPPKKYEDIHPFDFGCADQAGLWQELKSIVDYWIAQGVRVFRVDNPHTKPFALWEWLLGEVKQAHPETIFLSEAFTRPNPMHRLAKLGFSQSYTYFPWRNDKQEITEYFTELSHSPSRECFRPSAWTNTPDILTDILQQGGRPAFMSRLVLAATLSANYGIYGPVYELCENVARHPGSEEYRHSEKYQIRHWPIEQLNGRDSLAGLIGRVNRIRHDNPALQQDWRLQFHATDNPQLICYSKTTEDFGNVLITVVNLDPYHSHSGWVQLRLETLGLSPQAFVVQDLLTGARYTWQGPRNYVALDPAVLPAHVLRVESRVNA